MSTWVKLHDNFFRNPKVLAAGEDAALLYIQGLAYCSDGLTDGAIPTPALRTLTAKKEARTLARILVREGLWIETATGWQVHDYLKVQRSREQVEAEREKNRERQARSRSSRSSHAVTTAVTTAVSHADVTPPDTDTETEPETDDPPPTPALALVVTPAETSHSPAQRDLNLSAIAAIKARKGQARDGGDAGSVVHSADPSQSEVTTTANGART